MFGHARLSTAHPCVYILTLIDLNYSVSPVVIIQDIPYSDRKFAPPAVRYRDHVGHFGRFRTFAACRALRKLMKLLVRWERHERRQPCTTGPYSWPTGLKRLVWNAC